MRKCTVEMCSNKHYGKGYCKKHYSRVRRHGSTSSLLPLPDNDYTYNALLASRLVTSGSGCLDYQGNLKNGYGLMSYHGKNVLTHRLAWVLTNGSIPEGLFVLHRCDNRKCCNVTHLFLGTQQDNIADRVTKNRSAKGERQGSSKINDSIALLIVIMYKDGVGQIIIAETFNVSISIVGRVLSGKTWSHVTGITSSIKSKYHRGYVRRKATGNVVSKVSQTRKAVRDMQHRRIN